MLVLAASAYLLTAVALASDGQCPAVEAVRSKLDSVATAALQGRYAVQLLEVAGGVRISLLLNDGTALGTRELRGHDCTALGDATAVVLGTWLADLERKSKLALRPLTAAPPRSPFLVPGEPPPPGPAEAKEAVLALRLQLGALIVGAAGQRPSLSQGVSLLSRLGLERWEVQAGFDHGFQRSEPLGAGRVEWSRSTAALGIGRELAPGPWRVAAGIRGLYARVSSRGLEFTRNFSGQDHQTGLSPHLRVEWALKPRWSLVLEPGARYWLSPLSFRAEGSPGTLPLPRTEFWTTLGVGFQIF